MEAFIWFYGFAITVLPSMPFSIPSASVIAGDASVVLGWGAYLNRGLPIVESLAVFALMVQIVGLEITFRLAMWIINLLKP